MRNVIRLVVCFALLTTSCAHLSRNGVIHFKGRVVDGLNQPVPNATVRVFNGHMGINQFEIDAQTNMLTDGNGRFKGLLSGDLATTCRIIKKDGYEEIKQMGDWKTSEEVILLYDMTLTTNDISGLISLGASQQKQRFMEILASNSKLHKGGFAWQCFYRGDIFRPLLYESTRHQSNYVKNRATKVLRLIGDPRGINSLKSNRPVKPSKRISTDSSEQIVNMAIEYILEKDARENPEGRRTNADHANRYTVTRFTGYAKVNGHFADYIIYCSKKKDKWIFDYWMVTCIE